jgi:hypothetical protein
MRRAIFTFFIISILQSQLLFGQSSQTPGLVSLPLRSTFGPHQYNGGIQNWDITQDSIGFIYFANNHGLLEFDGARWTRYAQENQTKLRAAWVEKKSNKIYVGGQNSLGYYQRTDSSSFRYTDLTGFIPNELKKDEVWKIIELDGNLYANLVEDLVLIKEGTIEAIPGVDQIEFAALIGETIYTDSRNQGIYRLDKNNHRLVKLPGTDSFTGSLKGGFVNKGITYFFSYDGHIFSYSDDLKKLNTPLDQFLMKAKINTIEPLKNGRLAIGTQNDGVLVIDQRFQPHGHYTKKRGLSHRTVISLHQDEFENLWVGLNNGIEILELGSPFRLINEEVGLEGTGYRAINLMGEVFFGTSSGLYTPGTDEIIGPNSRYELINGSEGLVNNLSIVNNKLLVSHHEGAFEYQNGELYQFYDVEGTWGFRLFNDFLIGGTYNGIKAFKKENNQWVYQKAFEKLRESSRLIQFENDSVLWMTHGYKGAYKLVFDTTLTTQRVDQFGAGNGLPSNQLISVYKINDELIFTASEGIYLYNTASNQFTPHPFLYDYFSDKHVSKIVEIGNDLFYIADDQIGFIREEQLGVFKNYTNAFQKVNKYLNNDLENINILDNNQILIGAKEGFISFSRDQIQVKNPSLAPISI